MEHPPDQSQPSSGTAQGNHQQLEQLLPVEPIFRKRKTANPTEEKSFEKDGRAWKDDETSALLELVNKREFRPQRRMRNRKTLWDLVAKALKHKFPYRSSWFTEKRCSDRLNTLRGTRYYIAANKHLEKAEKDNGRNLTRQQRSDIIKTYGLEMEWYKAIKEYTSRPRQDAQGRSEKQMQSHLVLNATTDCPSSPVDTDPSEVRNAGKSVEEQSTYAQRFQPLTTPQRSTLLGLWHRIGTASDGSDGEDLSETLNWLSIVHRRRESAIRDDVMALEKKGLVSIQPEKGWIDARSVRSHKKFFEKVIRKNPAYDTCWRIQDKAVEIFVRQCTLSNITVLHIAGSEKLEVVDLRFFWKLRALSIRDCLELQKIIWCDSGLEELGSLIIDMCPFSGYPPLQKMTSLEEFYICKPHCIGSSHDLGSGELDVSGCVRLRTLTIRYEATLSVIRGLEGLHSLTALDLYKCDAFQTLPDIGHMKDLYKLDVSYTSVEEIKGVEKLSRLEKLSCAGSKLKTLPDLSFLDQLTPVCIMNSSMTKDESSPYFGWKSVRFKHDIEEVDVSDASDLEEDVSNVSG